MINWSDRIREIHEEAGIPTLTDTKSISHLDGDYILRNLAATAIRTPQLFGTRREYNGIPVRIAGIPQMYKIAEKVKAGEIPLESLLGFQRIGGRLNYYTLEIFRRNINSLNSSKIDIQKIEAYFVQLAEGEGRAKTYYFVIRRSGDEWRGSLQDYSDLETAIWKQIKSREETHRGEPIFGGQSEESEQINPKLARVHTLPPPAKYSIFDIKKGNLNLRLRGKGMTV